MNDKLLIKIAILCSVIGILGLFFISENLQLDIIQIENIDESFIGKNVNINAKINKITYSSGLTILDIEDETGNIKAIAYDTLQVDKDNRINIQGKIQEYENELEVIIEKLSD